MTYGIKTVVGITTLKTRSGFFGTVAPLFGSNWAEIKLFRAFTLADLWQYVFGCHLVSSVLTTATLLTYCSTLAPPPPCQHNTALLRDTSYLQRLTYWSTARHSLRPTQYPAA